jgi:hypothetical protein
LVGSSGGNSLVQERLVVDSIVSVVWLGVVGSLGDVTWVSGVFRVLLLGLSWDTFVVGGSGGVINGAPQKKLVVLIWLPVVFLYRMLSCFVFSV